jgi:chorismate synthase
VNIRTKRAVKAAVERSDVCAVPAAGVVAENACAIEMANAMIEKFGGDSMREMKRNFSGYIAQLKKF